MIIKATLGTLILILIVVIASSYYINKEGFDNITNTQSGASGVPSTAASASSNKAAAMPSVTAGAPVSGATKDVLNPSSVASTAAPVKPSSPIALIVPAPSAIASLKSALGATGATGATPLGAIPIGAAIGATIATDAKGAASTTGATLVDAATAANSTVPQRTDVVPEVAVSKCGYDAMTLQQRADLLKDIQSVVKNEILANRSVTPVVNNDVKSTAKTASVSQGKEYEDSCYKDKDYKFSKNSDDACPSMPDMAQYIKKDSIPCWGCSVDY